MRTVKEWKACLQVGKRVKQVWNLREGDVCHVLAIVQVQTNGIWVTRLGASRRSWMSFPKREEIVFTDRGWIRKEGVRDLAEYVWVEGDEGEEIRPEEGMPTPDGTSC